MIFYDDFELRVFAKSIPTFEGHDHFQRKKVRLYPRGASVPHSAVFPDIYLEVNDVMIN